MKKLIFILIVGLLISSCTYNESNNVKTTDTVGYYAARELRGLSVFKVRESTYLKSFNILKNNEKVYNISERKFDTTENCLKFSTYDHFDFGHPNFKEIMTSDYYIGDIKTDLHLYFYKDTLYRIFVGGDVDEIEKGFIQKYGEGLYSNLTYKDNTSSNYKFRVIKENITRKWRNQYIEAIYESQVEDHIGNNKKMNIMIHINHLIG